MGIVKISDLPLVDSPVEGTDLFVVVQDNVTKKAYASDIQTYVGFEEIQYATAGQTVFNLTTMTYAAGANNLQVFVDGVNQYEGLSYTETDNNTVTFSQGLHVGAVVKFSTVQTQTSLVNSAGAVTFLQAGTGAVPRSVQSKERDIVSVKDFGAVGDGVTNDTAAIQAAITALSASGGIVYFPAGTYVISSLLTVPDASYISLQGTGYSSQIKKNFNGDMVSLGSRCQMHGLYLNGNGSTYTGRGVIITTGAPSNPPSARYIKDCFINGTQSYGIEFVGAQSGYGSYVEGCQIIPIATSTPAIKLPNDNAQTGNRTFLNLWTGSNEICDLGSAENTIISGCTGAGPRFSGSVLKVTIVGCRITTNYVSSWVVKGNATSVIGNILSPTALTLHSTLVLCYFDGNTITAGTTITDNAPGATSSVANAIYLDIDVTNSTTTPTWGSDGTQPVLGNGSISCVRQRRGTMCKASVNFVAGSTTTFGTGVYTFTLPYTANRNSTGSAMFFDSNTGNVYAGTAYVIAGTNTVKVIPSGSTSFATNTAPFTWASGDALYFDVDFIIA
jgi:hypothetical protein